MANRLINASSPYLQQHAHNPVDWFPWGEEALNKAQSEDKPIIVSIGYSACHWCHVMERECFENPTLAKIMNEHFVCIKVDREERPDIDQIYMDSIHSMGLRGGWPLNVFLTPATEPFYGGTYFPPQQWQSILSQIANAFKNHRSQIDESAQSFVRSLNRSEIEKYALKDAENSVSIDTLKKSYENLAKNFDREWGGMNRAPKFPMPSIYSYLLMIDKLVGIEDAGNHALFTLERMALGGLYDAVGGGFARYSTDSEWFLPHFEKMLYDNGQLLSLYADAYRISHHPLFKTVIEDTINFIKRELRSPENGFFSALDADSEGEEGKFYVWTETALKELIDEKDWDTFAHYFNIKAEGNWEHGNNILFAEANPLNYCEANKIDYKTFEISLQNWKKTLLEARNSRVRPGLDDKILTSWNGLMLNGLIDAYRALGNEEYLSFALGNASFILEKLKNKTTGELYHSYKDGKASITGFLEDYAFVIEAFINLYQATFDEKWLEEANQLTQYVLKNFIDKDEVFFFFTDKDAEQLIARKKEVFDNVIPSSNSAMALNLYKLGVYFDNKFYIELAERMLSKVLNLLENESGYLANWGRLAAILAFPVKEIAISGDKCFDFRKELDKNYLPNAFFAGTQQQSNLSLLIDRSTQNNTKIYICENRTCKLPTESIEKAIELLN